MKYNSEQEVFDAVVAHAEQMEFPSYLNNQCVYRGDNGNKCLVGALIDDCDYSEELDREDDDGRGTSVNSLLFP